MNKRVNRTAIAVIIGIFVVAAKAEAGGGFKGGGMSRGGGMGRPAARPSMPNLGGGRPSGVARPAPSRPSVSRPSVSRPSVSRPSARPSPNLPNLSRPSLSRPAPGRPPLSGPSGLKPSLPSSRPSLSLPSNNRPGVSRPSLTPGTTSPPAVIPGTSTRPGTRPAIQRPSTRPSYPGIGGNRPSPSPGGDRPGFKLPNRPGGPDGRPQFPEFGGPNRPGIARPLPGDLGDFLGMDKPLRPTPLPNFPAGGDKPGLGGIGRPDGNWPGLGGGNRPEGGNRPGQPFRPGGDNNLINIGEINLGNNGIINNRPGWVNIGGDKITNIRDNWGNQIGQLGGWHNRFPDRVEYWNRWGSGVRDRWHHHHHHHDWFRPGWWGRHHHHWCGWHYGYSFSNHSFDYWWTIPTFAACRSFFHWITPSSARWSEPIYYDYGSGGNVVYENNVVYINDQQVATADEFAQTAMQLATVPPPASEEEAAAAEWMALGTFAISSAQEDVEPNRVIQLAVNRDGVVSGTLYNTQTDQADTVQGQVDQATQRVAFRIGESEDVVVETGLYNLTLQDVPILVHFGPEKTENWLLARLDASEEDADDS